MSALDHWVMTLNNYFQTPGRRSTNELQWTETLAGATWTATVEVERVGSFRGTGASRKAAREMAAQAAYTWLTTDRRPA
ncbi:hypothetical protein BKA62DRAFT_699649 [Auriculariales sp. MPI-PUGE-AT-0066]|nr:hypothetical protein BKA62DRAFT_699649 [Auriculariales sp. MPI-PUGE-AT-0066]